MPKKEEAMIKKKIKEIEKNALKYWSDKSREHGKKKFDEYSIAESPDGTMNVMLFKGKNKDRKLVRKIWIYPDGKVNYRDFDWQHPENPPTPEITVIKAIA